MKLDYANRVTTEPPRVGRYLVRPRFRVALALLCAGVASAAGSLVLAILAISTAGRTHGHVWLHCLAMALLAQAHLMSRWPEGAGIEPVRVAVVRWMSQLLLRVVALLSLSYLERGPVVATLWCFGCMLAHDIYAVTERLRRGEAFPPVR